MMLRSMIVVLVLSGYVGFGPMKAAAEPQDLEFFERDSARTIFNSEENAPEFYSPEKIKGASGAEEVEKAHGWDPGEGQRGTGKDTAEWSNDGQTSLQEDDAQDDDSGEQEEGIDNF